jgi:hypothetical protein
MHFGYIIIHFVYRYARHSTRFAPKRFPGATASTGAQYTFCLSLYILFSFNYIFCISLYTFYLLLYILFISDVSWIGVLKPVAVNEYRALIDPMMHGLYILFLIIHFVYHYTFCLSLYILFIIIHFVSNYSFCFFLCWQARHELHGELRRLVWHSSRGNEGLVLFLRFPDYFFCC